MRRPVASEVGVDRVEVPERRIDGVVFRRFATVGKAIRQHALARVSRERSQNRRCVGCAIGRQREAGECDHRVATPVTEPRIPGNNGCAVGLPVPPSLDNELIGGECELSDPFRRRICCGAQQ